MKFNKSMLFLITTLVLAGSASFIMADDRFLEEILAEKIRYGQIDKVREILQRSPEYVNREFDGAFPIHRAVDRGNLEMLNFLVQAGANIDEKTGNEKTALDLAIARGNTSVANYLRDLKGLGASTKTRMKDQRREAFTNVDVFFNK